MTSKTILAQALAGVAVVVDGHTANVHADLAEDSGSKFSFLPLRVTRTRKLMKWLLLVFSEINFLSLRRASTLPFSIQSDTAGLRPHDRLTLLLRGKVSKKNAPRLLALRVPCAAQPSGRRKKTR
ncbi:MAG: hypothetical protein R2864_07765 [Syntrophotaleaceae bacterium]